MSEQEPTIKDILIAMTSMEDRLRRDIGGDMTSMEDRLRGEIQESAKAVRNELRTEIQESAKAVKDELRTEIQESQTGTLEAIQGLASHMDDAFTKVHAEMATKDFVDRRFSQLDAKVGILTDALEKKSVISKEEAHDVMIAS